MVPPNSTNGASHAPTTIRSLPAAALAVLCLAALGACDKPASVKAVDPASTDQTAQSTTPPPSGDSTPKAADNATRSASEGTEQASRSSGSQSTVGTAASGAPPYSLNSAPEGNPAPKNGEPPRK